MKKKLLYGLTGLLFALSLAGFVACDDDDDDDDSSSGDTGESHEVTLTSGSIVQLISADEVAAFVSQDDFYGRFAVVAEDYSSSGDDDYIYIYSDSAGENQLTVTFDEGTDDEVTYSNLLDNAIYVSADDCSEGIWVKTNLESATVVCYPAWLGKIVDGEDLKDATGVKLSFSFSGSSENYFYCVLCADADFETYIAWASDLLEEGSYTILAADDEDVWDAILEDGVYYFGYSDQGTFSWKALSELEDGTYTAEGALDVTVSVTTKDNEVSSVSIGGTDLTELELKEIDGNGYYFYSIGSTSYGFSASAGAWSYTDSNSKSYVILLEATGEGYEYDYLTAITASAASGAATIGAVTGHVRVYTSGSERILGMSVDGSNVYPAYSSDFRYAVTSGSTVSLYDVSVSGSMSSGYTYSTDEVEVASSITVNGTTYTLSSMSGFTALANNDTSWTWWDGATDYVSVSGDFALYFTWTQSSDEFCDNVLKLYDESSNYWDFNLAYYADNGQTTAMLWGAGDDSLYNADNITDSSTTGDGFCGTWEVYVIRVGSTLAVYAVSDTGYEYQITQTNFTEAALSVGINGNPVAGIDDGSLFYQLGSASSSSK